MDFECTVCGRNDVVTPEGVEPRCCRHDEGAPAVPYGECPFCGNDVIADPLPSGWTSLECMGCARHLAASDVIR